MLVVGAIFGYLLSRAEAEEHLNPWQAIYSTLLTTITGADVDLDKGLGVAAHAGRADDLPAWR